jgi:hypothetical protein
VATWSTGEDDREVVSYGNDTPPRRVRTMLVLVALAALAVGFLVGSQTGQPPATPDEAAQTALPVAAGAVATAAGRGDGAGFEVPVFNPSDVEVTATVIGLPGWSPPLGGSAPTVVPPHGWAVVPFSAPGDCSTYPATVSSVRLRLDSVAGVDQRDVPLPEPAQVLRVHHDAVCLPNLPPDPRQLAAVWVVDQVPAGFPSTEILMRFDADGAFTLDAAGLLLTAKPWVRGRYRLDGENLTLVVDGGTACRPGDRFRWTVALLPDGRLESRPRSDSDGGCSVVPATWTARRLTDVDMAKLSLRR